LIPRAMSCNFAIVRDEEIAKGGLVLEIATIEEDRVLPGD